MADTSGCSSSHGTNGLPEDVEQCTCYVRPITPHDSSLTAEELDAMNAEMMEKIAARRAGSSSQLPDDQLCYRDDDTINSIRATLRRKQLMTAQRESADAMMMELQLKTKQTVLAQGHPFRKRRFDHLQDRRPEGEEELTEGL